ncbi:hypothetical protein J2Y45_003069 [Dyadobacter sp. BE34]|uniref:Uncharacterized protein n=1 Tax=Dyadobacter fermentans TaxID=94254 RepID=A0ABU1QU66_9BACT|nr:hypothetical protein [Dyadobacter fermentans]MDR7043618.1 hypothetical protein [Dyadobacter sp. BE242]MDR7197930.1 hypothetical protein [Dyadobacter sp. BE34]MDR7214637.1 hypothetical protein [Dyadobacter sp. BE31]MDR7262172.1 hypothetical protein [Dyadobacter sp. BE32]
MKKTPFETLWVIPLVLQLRIHSVKHIYSLHRY